jgi:hypothetical protein
MLLTILAVFLLIALVISVVHGLVSLNFQTSVSGVISGSSSTLVSGEASILANPTILSAQPATLTTRTNNTSGSLTMTNSNHGIVTGQRVDLYWSGGQCYGAMVGTVSGTTVPIASVAGGDNLPIATTAIKVGIANAVVFNLVGDNIQGLAMLMPSGANGYFVFYTGSANAYAQYVTAGQVASWYTGGVGTNPLAGDTITTVYISHDLTTGSISGASAAAVTN